MKTIRAAIATKERPIIFSGPMVQAILEGRKTQTRRIAKFVPSVPGLNLRFTGLSAGMVGDRWVLQSRDGSGTWNDRTKAIRCPYGVPGDRLWVRESFQVSPDGPVYRATAHEHGTYQPGGEGPWKPSIHMPRRLSRILLEITAVRVQRVQEISADDAREEGVSNLCLYCEAYGSAECDESDSCRGNGYEYRFQCVWDCINSKRGYGWDTNPWVWAITFKVVEVRG